MVSSITVKKNQNFQKSKIVKLSNGSKPANCIMHASPKLYRLQSCFRQTEEFELIVQQQGIVNKVCGDVREAIAYKSMIRSQLDTKF